MALVQLLTKSALVYSSVNFKGKPHHLSQLGSRELYPSMFSIRPGWGCHLHITSVSYPNVPALCIQMEAFILPLLGLHPSNAHLTGIPMFPATTVSDSVFSPLIWEALRALVFLQTDCCKALSGWLSWEKYYSVEMVWLQFDWLVARLEAYRSQYLQYYSLKRSASWRGVVVQHRGEEFMRAISQPCRKLSCSTVLFPNFWRNHEEHHVQGHY